MAAQHHRLGERVPVPESCRTAGEPAVGGIGQFDDVEMRTDLALPGMVVTLVVGGIVDDVGGRIPFPAHAEGGRAAAIHVERIAGMEPLREEMRQFAGGHPFADTRPPAVHDEQDQVSVVRPGHGAAGMPHALVARGIHIFQFAQVFPRQGRIDETLPHRVVVVDQHRGAGEDVGLGARGVEGALLRDVLPLPVEGDAHVPPAVAIDGRLALPVGDRRGEHRIVRHAGPGRPVGAHDDGGGLIAGIHRGDGLLAQEDVGRALRRLRTGEPDRIAGVGQVQVDGEGLLGHAGHLVQAAEMIVGDAFGDRADLPAVTGGRGGRGGPPQRHGGKDRRQGEKKPFHLRMRSSIGWMTPSIAR